MGSVRAAAVNQPIAGRHVASVNPVDVESAQPFLDELREFGGERRLLDFVFALQQVQRIRSAGFDLLAD
jgi:hypothetical protein